MRRLICLLLYVAMILGGCAILFGVLINGGRGFSIIAGGFLVGFGFYLLWTDFLSRDRSRTRSGEQRHTAN